MTICFITDHPFSEKEGVFYSGGGIPADMLRRYVRGDSKLIVLGRRSPKQNLTLASIHNSEFHLLANYRKPQDIFLKRTALRKELANFISEADGVVMRLPSPLGLVAYRICKDMGKPCAIEVCGSAYDMYNNYGNLIGKLYAPISERSHKKVIRDCDFVLYVTQKYLQAEYPFKPTAKTVACSNVALPQISESVLHERLAKISNHDGKRFVFGQIGNVAVSYKGYAIMLRAMSILKDQGFNLEYHIVGGGNPDALVGKAKEMGLGNNLVIRGRMDHNKIADFMREIDIYVHPSFLEGVPRAVIEAISHAVPSLVSNAGGTSELVPRRWVHESSDVTKLSKDILEMIQDKNLLSEAARENFERAKDYYPDVLNNRRSQYYDNFFNSLKQ